MIILSYQNIELGCAFTDAHLMEPGNWLHFLLIDSGSKHRTSGYSLCWDGAGKAGKFLLLSGRLQSAAANLALASLPLKALEAILAAFSFGHKKYPRII